MHRVYKWRGFSARLKCVDPWRAPVLIDRWVTVAVQLDFCAIHCEKLSVLLMYYFSLQGYKIRKIVTCNYVCHPSFSFTVITWIAWSDYAASQVGINVLSLISCGVVCGLLEEDMPFVKLALLFYRWFLTEWYEDSLKGMYCKSSWHYCSVVDFLRGNTKIACKGYTVSQVDIIVLSLVSYGMMRELRVGDML
jgi:hypothetical protein